MFLLCILCKSVSETEKMVKTPTVNVIEGDYGLVSLDIECIQSILYAKLNKVPVEFNIVNKITSCALYTTPSLECESQLINNFSNMMAYWKKTHCNTDQDLSPKECSESLALTNLVTMKLRPVLEFLYWVDQRNCEEFTSRWFMKALPFPFNYIYVKRRKHEALQLIETLYPQDSDIDVIKDFIVKSATQCLSILSTRLGKLKFFHGDNPSTLDVTVYAYLSPLVKLPFPSNDIPSVLIMWPNLTEFVKRVDQIYFLDITKEVKYLQNDKSNKQNDDEVSYAAIFILVVSATSLVLGFALKKGIIKFTKLNNN